MIDVHNEIDQLLTAINFTEEAPFKYVSLIIRYGIKNETKPKYQGIAKKYDELMIAIELDMTLLKSADKNGTLKSVFQIATLDALIDVANKYQLPAKTLIEKRAEIIRTTGIDLSC